MNSAGGSSRSIPAISWVLPVPIMQGIFVYTRNCRLKGWIRMQGAACNIAVLSKRTTRACKQDRPTSAHEQVHPVGYTCCFSSRYRHLVHFHDSGVELDSVKRRALAPRFELVRGRFEPVVKDCVSRREPDLLKLTLPPVAEKFLVIGPVICHS